MKCENCGTPAAEFELINGCCHKCIYSMLETVRVEFQRLYKGIVKNEDSICQTLGKALGYPYYKDDQKNFPGTTEADGVCVGSHTAASVACEAVDLLKRLQARLDLYEHPINNPLPDVPMDRQIQILNVQCNELADKVEALEQERNYLKESLADARIHDPNLNND